MLHPNQTRYGLRLNESIRSNANNQFSVERLYGVTVPFTVAAASWQILVIYFVVACFRFFFYHETLSTLLR